MLADQTEGISLASEERGEEEVDQILCLSKEN